MGWESRLCNGGKWWLSLTSARSARLFAVYVHLLQQMVSDRRAGLETVHTFTQPRLGRPHAGHPRMNAAPFLHPRLLSPVCEETDSETEHGLFEFVPPSARGTPMGAVTPNTTPGPCQPLAVCTWKMLKESTLAGVGGTPLNKEPLPAEFLAFNFCTGH